MLTMSDPRCYRCVSWVLWAPSIGLTLLRKSALPGVYYFRGGLLFCSVGRCEDVGEVGAVDLGAAGEVLRSFLAVALVEDGGGGFGGGGEVGWEEGAADGDVE